MNIQIPKNTFKHEGPREEIVHKICDVFLKNDIARFEVATLGLGDTTKVLCDRDFGTTTGASGEVIIRESEMQAAFDALTGAGYHVFLKPNYDRRTACYIVRKEDYPPREGWFEVKDLQHHWD